MFELEPADYLYSLGLDFDIDAQLMAIRGVLQRNRKAEAALAQEIERIEVHTRRLKGVLAELAVDQRVDNIEDSIYQDAAHSMAAVGMLAPLVETIFYRTFLGIGKSFVPTDGPTKTNDRWKAKPSLWWDCHFFLSEKTVEENLVRGILQLLDAIRLSEKLSSNLPSTLSALFAYRNKMFHLGFEWPVEERDRFVRRIDREKWPADWFPMATSGSKPWIVYISDSFIEHCLTSIDEVLKAIGLFVRDELSPKLN